MDAKAHVGRLGVGDLLSPRDASVVLHCSVATVYRAIKRGELAAFRLGETGTLRVPGIAIENFLTVRTVREAERATAAAPDQVAAQREQVDA